MRRIKQPVLVMGGYNDWKNTQRRHEFMVELIPYAKLEVIPNAGQVPTLENPDAVTAALRTWMRQPLVLR
jgi:pimeloyl-ACP methyl ester carboxylesterase